MIIVLNQKITEKQKSTLMKYLNGHEFRVRTFMRNGQSVIGAIGQLDFDHKEIEVFPGVDQVIPINKPYKMASRHFHPQDTVISIGPVKIGGSRIVTIAGPCAVETRQQIIETAWAVKEAGGVMLRGGAYKPRTSPYAFQGLGEKGLEYMVEAREQTGLPIVSEVVSPRDTEMMSRYIDVFQIGTRNMQNFELLKVVGAVGKPVILKRGLAATIEEWLMAAEYLLASGTDDVILCERGIRTFGRETRNTLDISAIPVVKERTHLPVIVDPSHATGIRDKVLPMALASIAAGAHGLIIEVHTNPDKAYSDGAQTLWPQQFDKLMRDVEALAPTVNREIARLPDKHQPEVLQSHMIDADITGSDLPKVGFQGIHGANSEHAIKHFFPENKVVSMPFNTFEEIFDAVLTHQVFWGMLPIENSLAGSVLDNYDLLSRYPDVKIVGEIKIRIQHNLLCLPDADENSIENVYSHPQALAQCSGYIKKKGWRVTPYFDTAGAAALIVQENNIKIAAIASMEAAHYYKLKVLAENIETNPHNYTRFAIIAHTNIPNPENSDKVSFTFTLKDHPGSLASCLSVLNDHQVNMTKLESRPIPGKPWSYIFYVDALLPGSPQEFDAVENLLANAFEDYRRLGLYRSS